MFSGYLFQRQSGASGVNPAHVATCTQEFNASLYLANCKAKLTVMAATIERTIQNCAQDLNVRIDIR
jgi:hypothetical protein